MKNLFRLFGVIALVAVIGFSFAACGGGDDGPSGGDPLANQVNGTWKAGNGEEITLNNGSFVKSQNNKQSMRGTYTAAARSISANLTMAVNELHGDYLTELEEGPTFENKWYNKNQVTDAFRKWLKDENPALTDAQINNFLATQSGEIDALFPTKTAEINGDTMTLDGIAYTKNGGNNNNSNMTWTAVTNPPFGTSISSGIYAIAYGNGRFVAVGSTSNKGKLAYSPDGVTWTAVTTNAFDYTTPSGNIETDTSIYAIAFGNGKFVAGGSHGQMAYSPDGVNWTAIPPTASLSQIDAIAYGNGTFVVGSNMGQIAYSSDNIETWTFVKNPIDANIIAFGNGIFVAGSNWYGGGDMAYSTDNGITWTAVTTDAFDYVDNGETYQRQLKAIGYGNGKFVAVGGYGKMATSTDGRTWTAVSDSTFGTDSRGDINAIAYGNGIFVAGGHNGGKMATSTNGTTWTSFDTGTRQTGAVKVIAFGNGRFVAGYTLGGIDYSTGGETGGNNTQTASYTGTAGGTSYTLKVTGDSYELTAGTKKSTGTVNNVSGGVLTLKPSNATTTFTATVSGNSITALNGTITWTDNTTASAPGTFTTGTNPGAGGTLTITDIPSKYNGKYATFSAPINALEGIGLVGSENGTYSRISNGKVSIPAWRFKANTNTNEVTYERYSGNDTLDPVSFIIYEVGTSAEVPQYPNADLVLGSFRSVTFSNGSVTKLWTDLRIISEK